MAAIMPCATTMRTMTELISSAARIAISCVDASLNAAATALAAQMALPLAAGDPQDGLWLVMAPVPEPPGYRLELVLHGADAPGPVCVDFVGGRVGHRRRVGEGRKQPLARAVGLKHGANPSVVDATGGLGRDAFVLATLGCTLRVVERSAVIAALLHNGLQRAHADAATAPVVARMQLIESDARNYLVGLVGDTCPDVIYLDPMYPERRKTALVKKEMRVLRAVTHGDFDAAELLDVARATARQRVVVKRPQTAAPLRDDVSMTIASENTRFDVYLSK